MLTQCYTTNDNINKINFNIRVKTKIITIGDVFLLVFLYICIRISLILIPTFEI